MCTSIIIREMDGQSNWWLSPLVECSETTGQSNRRDCDVFFPQRYQSVPLGDVFNTSSEHPLKLVLSMLKKIRIHSAWLLPLFILKRAYERHKVGIIICLDLINDWIIIRMNSMIVVATRSVCWGHVRLMKWPQSKHLCLAYVVS